VAAAGGWLAVHHLIEQLPAVEKKTHEALFVDSCNREFDID
jgi:hypothetical protein